MVERVYIVIIIYDSVIEPQTNRGLSQQQQDVREKPSVILYNYYIDRQAGTQNKPTTKDTIGLDYS